jgi:glycine cleavage system aminomethyltransferase T
VSMLDFISPDRARIDGGFSPTLISPMGRRQRDAGATFVERDGWLVPVSTPGEQEHLASVGIGDLSHLGKTEVNGKVPDSVVGDTVWHRIAADKAIVLCPTNQAAAVRARLAEVGASVLDVTGAYAILVVTGPEAAAVMRRLTHLPAFPASGDVSHVTAHVLEQEGAFWIVFPQEYGHYLWEVAVDAAEPFGGGPVGVDSIPGARP